MVDENFLTMNFFALKFYYLQLRIMLTYWVTVILAAYYEMLHLVAQTHHESSTIEGTMGSMSAMQHVA